VKILLDTSVLVAAFVEHHPRHAASLACHRDALRADEGLCIAAHSLAEVYAVLTRLPVRPPIAPGVARRLVRENLLGGAKVIEMDREDYAAVLDRMADNALTGGAIYDALVVQAALKADVDRVHTWNGADFRRVWPEAGSRLDVLA
jgi:predicted nucleic acid-binding protein